MNRLFSFLIILASAILIFSCGGSKNKTVDYADTLTLEDTTAAIALSEVFLKQVVSGDISGALSSIGYIDWDEASFSHLTSEMYSSMKTQYEKMNIKRFEQTRCEFISPNENYLYYRVYFGEGTDNASLLSTLVAFNAIKIDGKWYLAMK